MTKCLRDKDELPIGKANTNPILDTRMYKVEYPDGHTYFMVDGHKTKTPAVMTYSSMVSRDSVQIALMIAVLNDLNIMACDIQNAYLLAECRERI